MQKKKEKEEKRDKIKRRGINNKIYMYTWRQQGCLQRWWLQRLVSPSMQHAGTIHGDKKRDVVPNIKNAAQKGGAGVGVEVLTLGMACSGGICGTATTDPTYLHRIRTANVVARS